MAPHCLADIGYPAESVRALGAIHSGRGFDPACRDRRMTMRHWITSFQLVDDESEARMRFLIWQVTGRQHSWNFMTAGKAAWRCRAAPRAARPRVDAQPRP